MAQRVGGGAVGACVIVVFGCFNESAGVGRNFMEIYRTSVLPQTKRLWVPPGRDRGRTVCDHAQW